MRQIFNKVKFTQFVSLHQNDKKCYLRPLNLVISSIVTSYSSFHMRFYLFSWLSRPFFIFPVLLYAMICEIGPLGEPPQPTEVEWVWPTEVEWVWSTEVEWEWLNVIVKIQSFLPWFRTWLIWPEKKSHELTNQIYLEDEFRKSLHRCENLFSIIDAFCSRS